MSGFFQNLLKDAAGTFFGSDFLRDYTHASKTFRTNGYQYSPKFKFLFHVYFDINPEAYSQNVSTGANFGLASGQFKGYSLAGFEDWLIFGAEDKILANSDRDFNDVVFAVKLGSPAASVPEPSTIAALMGVSAAFGVSRRKNGNKS
jgi:hypothetical protein